VADLVSRLRCTAVDPAAPVPLRAAATRRLAVLAAATGVTGRPLVPAADPERWWGLAEPTASAVPVRPAVSALALSGSQLSTITSCPLRWFLEHEARGDVVQGTAMGFGSVLHALADAVAKRRLEADAGVLGERLDEVWDELAFEAPWQAAAERAEAGAALSRFLTWHDGRPDRRLVASEHEFDLAVPIGDQGVRLVGSFDRVEVDAAGDVHVVDLKTQKSKVANADLPRHPQLGVYQLAVAAGALDSVPDDVRDRNGLTPAGAAPVVAGAELVLLRIGPAGGSPAVQSQPPLAASGTEGGSWVTEALSGVEEMVRAERFHPTPGTACRVCAFRSVCPAVDEGAPVIP
jgi:RecB family exonuclease